MKATNKLRFVERLVPAPEHGENIGKTVRILQQWWLSDQTGEQLGFGKTHPGEVIGRWIDVPIEQE